jgi:hypothetical protein
MRLWIQDLNSGQGIVLTDNSGNDTSGLLGMLAYSGSIGGFGISMTTGLSQPVVGGVTSQAELALQSLNIRSSAGSGTGRLRVVLEDINYNPISSGSRTLQAVASGNLSGGSTANKVTFNAWASASNSVPGFGVDRGPGSALGALGALPGDAIAVWPGGVTFGMPAGETLTSFSTSGANVLNTSGAYSLFTELIVELNGGGALSLSNLNVAVTPEPATMLLFGTGASAVAWAKRRRRKANQAVVC